MNEINLNPEDAKLRDLLRQSRVAPALPPRFQEGVWRRIESAEAARGAARRNWLDSFVQWVLRPKPALVGMAVLMLTGSLIGVHEGAQNARHDAQARSLAVVAPNVLR
jgi:hypothetical protein